MKNAERYGRTTRRASFLWVAVLLAACGGPADQPSAEVAAVVLPEGAVPLEYDGHIRFEATVGDSVPARLLFDTGAAGLYLDSLWQERSGIGAETRTETWMAAGAGTQPVRCGVLFDEITFRMDTIVHTSRMTPLLDFRGMLGRGSDGIFGLQYMAGYCVEFDLKEGWMRAVARYAATGRVCPLPAGGGERQTVSSRPCSGGRQGGRGPFPIGYREPWNAVDDRSGLGGRIVPAGCGFVSDDIGRCRGKCRIAVLAGGFGLVLRQ